MSKAGLPIISMWLASFIMSIAIGVYNPVIPLLQADLNFTYAQVGLMTTAMIFSYAALQLPSGHIRERIGSKRLIVLGLFAMTVSTFLLGSITNISQAYVLRFIAGMGMAGVFVPAMNVLIHLLRDRGKGFAIGMYGMAQAVGFIFISFLAPILSVELGWRLSTMIISSIGFIAIPLIWFSYTQEPEELEIKESSKETYRFLLKSKEAWALALGHFIRFGLIVAVTTWIPTFLFEIRGFTIILAGLAAALINIMSLIATPMGGILSDKTRNKSSVVITNFILLGPVIFIVAFVDTVLATWIGIIGVGFLLFFYFAPMYSLASDLFPKFGAVSTSYQNMWGSIGAMILPSVFGILRDSTGTFDASWALMGILSLVGAGIMLAFLRVPVPPDSISKI